MTPEDLASALYAAPANSGGSDNLFMVGAARHGFWATLRKVALLISPLSSEAPDSTEDGVKEWENIELHYIWCDQSAWESPWATVSLRAELEEAKKAGKRVREVTMTRIRGANTFVCAMYSSASGVFNGQYRHTGISPSERWKPFLVRYLRYERGKSNKFYHSSRDISIYGSVEYRINSRAVTSSFVGRPHCAILGYTATFAF